MTARKAVAAAAIIIARIESSLLIFNSIPPLEANGCRTEEPGNDLPKNGADQAQNGF